MSVIDRVLLVTIHIYMLEERDLSGVPFISQASRPRNVRKVQKRTQ
jgi:hypothetical protein